MGRAVANVCVALEWTEGLEESDRQSNNSIARGFGHSLTKGIELLDALRDLRLS
jgi:hypothetical protein